MKLCKTERLRIQLDSVFIHIFEDLGGFFIHSLCRIVISEGGSHPGNDRADPVTENPHYGQRSNSNDHDNDDVLHDRLSCSFSSFDHFQLLSVFVV